MRCSGKPRYFRQNDRDIGVANGQFFSHDTTCQIICARTAIILGQRHRAKAHLRGLIENRRQQRAFKWFQTLGLKGDVFDFLCDEVPDRITKLQLLRT
jgi:hypothetical protein